MEQVWGALFIFAVCPLLGGLPLTGWWVQLLTGKRLSQIGTGNVGVSAAFYHGGKGAGILAALSEAAKGIGAVLLARQFFPDDPVWEVIALIALVLLVALVALVALVTLVALVALVVLVALVALVA